MILYIDTSLLVGVLTHEGRTAELRGWFRRQSAEDLIISEWVGTELASALALKQRTRQIDADQRAAAAHMFSEMTMKFLSTVPVVSGQFRMAAQFAGRADLALRASDALHLAICADHAAMLCTLDRRLIDAAPPLGIAVEVP